MSIAARSPRSTLKTLRGRKLSGAASSRRRMLQLGKSSANKVAHRGDRRRAKPPLVSNGLCARFAHLEPCRVLANRRQTKCNTRRLRRIGERLQHHEVSCSLRRAEAQARQWISGRRTPSETERNARANPSNLRIREPRRGGRSAIIAAQPSERSQHRPCEIARSLATSQG